MANVRLRGDDIRRALTQRKAGEHAIADELSRTDLGRIETLVSIATEERINLGRCLTLLFGREDVGALSNLRGLRQRFNEAATRVGSGVRFAVDSAKKTAPSDRHCWFTGPNPDVGSAEAFSRDSTSDVAQLPRVRSRAIATSGDAVARGKRQVRFFVSYAHDDRVPALDLVKGLKAQFKPSARYELDVFVDRQILTGEKWKAEIEQAIAACDFGLLLVSPAFLGSEFIAANEIPAFVSAAGDAKPLIAVGLEEVNFARHDLKGLEQHQVFRLDRRRAEACCYSALRAQQDKTAFVRELFEQIEARLDKVYSPEHETSAVAGLAVTLDDVVLTSEARLGLHPDFRRWVGERPAHFQRTKTLPTSLAALESLSSSNLSQQGARDALTELRDWAQSTDPKSPVFCAVLGEYGVGKTTTLKQLTTELLAEREAGKDVPLPIYVDLRLQVGSPTRVPTLEELLTEVIKRNHHLTTPSTLTAQEIVRLVREEGAVLIFDGLDEKIVHLPPAEARSFIRELWRALPDATRRAARAEGTRPGRLVLSCRSHYFRDVVSQSSMLVGEGREGITREDYRVLLMLPFDESQILGYLEGTLGSKERAVTALEIIGSIHNLRDLAHRPVLLSHIAEHIGELEALRSRGETVNAARLYDLVVQRWLARDDGKHQLDPLHKRLLMERLAATMAREHAREWDADRLEQWLDEFLHAEPAIGAAYAMRDRRVLKEDFRTATFVVRPEHGDHHGHFRFAHSSLQEFFHASYLYKGLMQGQPERWAIDAVSIETIHFVGQWLALKSGEVALNTWTTVLERGVSGGSRHAFRLWLEARANAWPTPTPRVVNLEGAELEEWRITGSPGRRLDLRNARLAGAHLSRAHLAHVDLLAADAREVALRQAECLDVNVDGASFEGADVSGSVWRLGSARDTRFARALLAGSQWIGIEGTSFGIERLGLGWLGRSGSPPAPFASRTEAQTLEGHTDWVSSCSWAPDGTRLASAGWDRTVRVWEVASGRCVQTLEGHTNAVTSCAWAPDGRRLASGSPDGTVKVWEVASGRCVQTLESPTNRLRSCAWAPDGTRLSAGSHDGTVKVWEVASGRCVQTLEGHTKGVTSCTWAPDGARLASGSDDGTVRVWELPSGRCVQTLEGHTNRLTSCAWAPDGTRLASGSQDGTVRVWGLATGRCVQMLEGHTNGVTSCAWAPDGMRLASGSYDGTVRVWEPASGRCVQALDVGTYGETSCAWAPDGTRLASAGWDRTVRVWEVASGRCVQALEGHANGLTSCAWAPDGMRLASGSDDGTVRVWEVASGRCVQTLEGHTNRLTSCAWAPDGTRLASGSDDGTVRVWEVASGRSVQTLEGHTNGVTSCTWAPDGTRLASGSHDGTLRVWDVASGRSVRTLVRHSNGVASCAWALDGRRLASGSHDGTVRVWEVASGRCAQTLRGHTDWVTSCTWAPDGMRLASGSHDGTVRVWEVASGRCVQTLRGHTDWVTSCTWAPDGTRLAAGSDDGTVRVWEVASGHCVQTLQGHTNGVTSCAWAPDGTRLASAGDDGKVRVLEVTSAWLTRLILQALPEREWASISSSRDAIHAASPNAWRWINWRITDSNGRLLELLPAEAFGPLPN